MLCSPTVCYDFVATEAKRIAYKTLLVNVMSTSSEVAVPRPGRVPMVVAKAMSSVGFALSVFAIWLDWVFPTTKPLLPELRPRPGKRDKSRRRRSAPASLGSSARRRSHKRNPIPVRANTSPSVQDVPAPGQTPSASQESQQASNIDSSSLVGPPDPNSRASLSSSSTLPSTPPSHLAFTQGHLDTCDESVESDGSRLSSRRSVSTAARLPRMKLFMGKTRKASLSKPKPEADSPAASTTELHDEAVKPTRKPTSNLVPPWAIPRTTPTADTNSETVSVKTPSRLFFARRPLSARPTTSPSASTASPQQQPQPATPTPTSASATCFSRKADRRRSAPVPRTQPYDYPYFAAMPTPVDDTSFIDDEDTRRRSADEVGRRLDRNPVTSSPEQSEGWRGRDAQQVNTAAQAELGHGRLPSPKRRSTSDTWSQRRVSAA